ncbi:MAG: nicotinate (nicotinamide) nucleotide adenylyltransferase [Acidobacteria bacterium]|nr:nicotinate (nicotinamide) nucleotide adenylyltransferase [Acidobacteriota bacterium]MBW4044457.1 nicotinate (nicotinamide) nucleotide adenylyltransferase [Acidobacteriota bacterium]
MRIALFGGSFDPPHRGHLAIARAALVRLQLDRVLFAPVGSQPLKRGTHPASFEDRVAMVNLAIADEPHFALSLADSPHPDGKPNYTIDTIALVREELSPADELFLLLGADSFLSIRKWHRAGDLLLACPVIVASRPGFSLAQALRALPAGITDEGEVSAGDITARRLLGPGGRTSTLYLLPDIEEEVSATAIRNSLARGAQPDSTIAPQVRDYILRRELYRAEPARVARHTHPAS